MVDGGKRNILGVLIDAVDYEAAVGRIVAAAQAGAPMGVSALAVHGVMTGVLDWAQRSRLNQLELVVPDGQPVRWALNLLHRSRLVDRVYGPRLTLEVCRRAAEEGLPVYLYGSRPEVLGRLTANLTRRLPGLRIAGSRPSLFRRSSAEEKRAIVREIRESGARIVLVGLGCPRQEAWAFEYREALSMPVVAVGAAFDFHAGSLPQAPERLQRLGLEWAFRLRHEPGRLWRRYLFLNPYYLLLVSCQMAWPGSFAVDRTPALVEDMNYA